VSHVFRDLVRRGLSMNQRASLAAANSIDWVFKRDTLIQSGRTWFELVHDADLMSVRHYELPDEKEIELADGEKKEICRDRYEVPLVLVPPLGVSSEAFDLMPQRSLARYMVAAGFKVYLVDWGRPRDEHAHLDLADYSYDMLGTALEKIRHHSGIRDLSMMGWCMGGLLCLLHQGQVKDKHIRNIVTVASPIDLQTGSGVIGAVGAIAQALDGPAKLIGSYTRLSLDPSHLSLPEWATKLVFKMTDPIGSATAYWDLIARLWDRQFVESYSTTSHQLNNMLRYPGGVLKDMLGGAAVENQLAKGKMKIGDRTAEIDAIESSLLAFAGETDSLVPPDVARKIIDVVAGEDVEFRLAPGGHMGVVIGSVAQSAVWAQTAEWLEHRSGALCRSDNKSSMN
jgi:poly[(R)-3-hydroxyalkanoate] polymerase subunit PhaC